MGNLTITAEYARASGLDAGNMRMRKGGRQAWSIADREHATSVTNRLLLSVPFSLGGLGGLTFTPAIASDLGVTAEDIACSGNRMVGHNGGPLLSEEATPDA